MTQNQLRRINNMNRGELISALTANCSCPTERQAIANLGNDSLRILLANTLTAVGKGSDTVQGGGEEESKEGEEIEYQSRTDPNVKVPTQTGDAKMKGVTRSPFAAEELMGDGAGVKPVGNEAVLNALDPESREVLLEGRQRRSQEKAAILNHLVANLQGTAQDQAYEYLRHKDLKELRFLAQLQGQPQRVTNTLAPPVNDPLPGAPIFVGNGGGGDYGGYEGGTNNEANVLPLPGINWNEGGEPQARPRLRTQVQRVS